MMCLKFKYGYGEKQYNMATIFDPLMCFQTFARSDLAWAFGSSGPHSSLLTTRARESHQTFALDFLRLLSEMKFSKTSYNWWHILGSGFQHVEIYHKEASITWLATQNVASRRKLAIGPCNEFLFERKHKPIKISFNSQALCNWDLHFVPDPKHLGGQQPR